MEYENVLVDRDGPVGVVTLNRPKVLNALSPALVGELNDALSHLDADPEVRAAVLTGGPRVFAAGADIGDMAERSPIDQLQRDQTGRWGPIAAFTKPLIAAVNGYCLAGGLELALICDIRVASERARFGTPEVKWNLLHGFGAQLLPGIVGFNNAMYLLLTGRFIDAHEAHRIGLVQEVVAPDRVLPRARELAEEICANAPMAVRMTKELALRSRDLTLADGIRLYQALNRIVEASADLEEGTRAFAEKRKPEFKNR